MLNDTELGRGRHRGVAVGTLLAAVVACGGPPTGAALVELPDLVVITRPQAAGAAVHLELQNDTGAEVTVEPLPCATRIEQFRFGEWAQALPPPADCTGVPVVLPPGASQGYLAEMPPAPGRYRAALTGTTARGTFVVQSGAFDVP